MVLLSEVRSYYGRLKLYVNGEWIDSESTQILHAVNPAKDEIIAEIPMTTKEEVDNAIEVAREAFEKWREVPVPTRVKYIYKLRALLEEHFEEISRIIVQNHGKTIDESRGEMRRLLENVETACSIAYTLAKGEHLDIIATGIDETLVREPVGVFAIIGPFNFPVLAPFWFIPHAIALGCTVVVKPSEITPIPMDWTFKVIEKIGLPPGVVNLVHGGADVVNALIDHKDVKGIAFVGSTRVGKIVYSRAGERGKRAIVQAGAKNFVVVMPDADIKKAIPSLLTSFFGNTGQRCLSGAVLVAVGNAYEELKDKFVEASSKLKLGYGLDEETEVGPLATKKAKERVLGYIEKGIEEGAKLILDGRNVKVPEYPKGYFVGPTIFDEVTPDMTIAKEEIFGPVASIMRVDNLDEAIETINKSNYGNAACVFTSSGGTARKFRREVEAGNIGINIGIAAPMAFFPFGGRKDSFFGILHGQIDCVDFFTDKKIVISRWW